MCEHDCVLGVPINEKGVQLVEMTYDLYTPDLEDNLRWFQFSLEEIDKVYDLIDEFNQTFGMLIDNYEEEVLAADKVPEALFIAKKHLEEAKEHSKRKILNRIIEALQLANDTKMPVGFYL